MVSFRDFVCYDHVAVRVVADGCAVEAVFAFVVEGAAALLVLDDGAVRVGDIGVPVVGGFAEVAHSAALRVACFRVCVCVWVWV